MDLGGKGKAMCTSAVGTRLNKQEEVVGLVSVIR